MVTLSYLQFVILIYIVVGFVSFLWTILDEIYLDKQAKSLRDFFSPTSYYISLLFIFIVMWPLILFICIKISLDNFKLNSKLEEK